jgi:hypothetical protein
MTDDTYNSLFHNHAIGDLQIPLQSNFYNVSLLQEIDILISTFDLNVHKKFKFIYR